MSPRALPTWILPVVLAAACGTDPDCSDVRRGTDLTLPQLACVWHGEAREYQSVTFAGTVTGLEPAFSAPCGDPLIADTFVVIESDTDHWTIAVDGALSIAVGDEVTGEQTIGGDGMNLFGLQQSALLRRADGELLFWTGDWTGGPHPLMPAEVTQIASAPHYDTCDGFCTTKLRGYTLKLDGVSATLAYARSTAVGAFDVTGTVEQDTDCDDGDNDGPWVRQALSIVRRPAAR